LNTTDTAPAKKGVAPREIAMASLFAALIAAGALVALPIGPVPFTLQVLFVLMAGLLLRPRAALAAIVVYLLLGAIGMPVFSAGRGGLAVLVGPTGGYLFGFALAAPLISYLTRRPAGPRLAHAGRLLRSALGFAACLAGVAVIYVLGTLWLASATGIGVYKATAVGALPFLPFDVVKAFVAVAGAQALERVMKPEAVGARG
jgi:biotin transport system substrate-specific component